MMSRLAAMLLVAVLALSGCALLHKKPAAAKPVPVARAVARPTPPPQKRPPQSFWHYLSPFPYIASISKLMPHKAKPPTAQPPQLVGTVKMVNKEDKFVLIDGASFQQATSGDLLVCITDQKETANLRVSTMRNPPFLIADITSGMPAPGDKVYKP